MTFTVRPFLIVYGIGFILSLILGVHLVWALIFVGLAVWGPEIEIEWKRRSELRRY